MAVGDGRPHHGGGDSKGAVPPCAHQTPNPRTDFMLQLLHEPNSRVQMGMQHVDWSLTPWHDDYRCHSR